MSVNTDLFSELYTYFDKDAIKELLLLAIESIHNNIKLIQDNLISKNNKEIFRGCHSLKNLSLLGDNMVVTISTQMTLLVRNAEYNNIDIIAFNILFKSLKEHSNKLIKIINDELLK